MSADRQASPAWMADAACAGMDPALFHPARGADARAARDVCARCPVAADCLDHALTRRERRGVWGGLTADQRARLTRRR